MSNVPVMSTRRLAFWSADDSKKGTSRAQMAEQIQELHKAIEDLVPDSKGTYYTEANVAALLRACLKRAIP